MHQDLIFHGTMTLVQCNLTVRQVIACAFALLTLNLLYTMPHSIVADRRMRLYPARSTGVGDLQAEICCPSLNRRPLPALQAIADGALRYTSGQRVSAVVVGADSVLRCALIWLPYCRYGMMTP